MKKQNEKRKLSVIIDDDDDDENCTLSIESRDNNKKLKNEKTIDDLPKFVILYLLSFVLECRADDFPIRRYSENICHDKLLQRPFEDDDESDRLISIGRIFSNLKRVCKKWNVALNETELSKRVIGINCIKGELFKIGRKRAHKFKLSDVYYNFEKLSEEDKNFASRFGMKGTRKYEMAPSVFGDVDNVEVLRNIYHSKKKVYDNSGDVMRTHATIKVDDLYYEGEVGFNRGTKREFFFYPKGKTVIYRKEFGMIYMGEINDMRVEGNGIGMIIRDGSIFYIGGFLDGIVDGMGMFFFKGGRSRYHGYFNKKVPYGKATYAKKREEEPLEIHDIDWNDDQQIKRKQRFLNRLVGIKIFDAYF